MSSSVDKTKTSSRAICTIITKSYLAYARALATSISRNNPDIPLYVLLADKVDRFFDSDLEPFKLVLLEELPDQQVIERMCFYYTPFELCCALRGFLHQYMLEQTNAQSWLFLDSDIMVFSSLDVIFEQLLKVSILLTPHCRSPIEKEFIYPHETNIISGGLYNAGFLGLNRTEEAQKFIYWFKERLELYSLNDFCKRQFVDQMWLNLVPLYFKDVEFCSAPGANLGHWNLFERNLEKNDHGTITADGKPLLFIHFSGWNIDHLQNVSEHAPMYKNKTPLLWVELGEAYRELLLDSEHIRTKAFPYAFDYFADGEVVTPTIRRVYYDDVLQGKELEDAPFSKSKYFYARIKRLSKPSLFRRCLNKLLSLFYSS